MNTQTVPSLKEQFLKAYEQEYATTVRVVRAYPTNQSELRPQEMCRTARELAWIFVIEQAMREKAMTTGFDWTVPPAMPPAPDSVDAVLAAFEHGHDRLMKFVRDLPEERLTTTIKFPTAPRTMSDVPLIDFLWMTLFDQIHHRGQFSIYLRMAGGKVPSIYGPTADEPWF